MDMTKEWERFFTEQDKEHFGDPKFYTFLCGNKKQGGISKWI
jgi:hypothetical protein